MRIEYIVWTACLILGAGIIGVSSTPSQDVVNLEAETEQQPEPPFAGLADPADTPPSLPAEDTADAAEAIQTAIEQIDRCDEHRADCEDCQAGRACLKLDTIRREYGQEENQTEIYRDGPPDPDRLPGLRIDADESSEQPATPAAEPSDTDPPL